VAPASIAQKRSGKATISGAASQTIRRGDPHVRDPGGGAAGAHCPWGARGDRRNLSVRRAEQLVHTVAHSLRHHVTEGEWEDIKASVPKELAPVLT